MMNEERSERLDRLWEAYRQATAEPEPSVNFMPQLWARIDAARPGSWTIPLTRLAARLLPLAAAATLAMGAYVWRPVATGGGGTSISSGYVDVLAADLMEEQKPALWLTNADES